MNGKGITLKDEEFLKVRKDICNKYKDYHCCECPLFEHKCGLGDDIKEIAKIVNGFEIDRLFDEIQGESERVCTCFTENYFSEGIELFTKNFHELCELWGITKEAYSIEISENLYHMLKSKIINNKLFGFKIVSFVLDNHYFGFSGYKLNFVRK